MVGVEVIVGYRDKRITSVTQIFQVGDFQRERCRIG